MMLKASHVIVANSNTQQVYQCYYHHNIRLQPELIQLKKYLTGKKANRNVAIYSNSYITPSAPVIRPLPCENSFTNETY